MNNLRDEKFLKEFGSSLRKVRKQRGITMETLAFDAGIDYRQLGRIERGEVNTTISTVLTLATALSIDVAELFAFHKTKKPQR